MAGAAIPPPCGRVGPAPTHTGGGGMGWPTGPSLPDRPAAGRKAGCWLGRLGAGWGHSVSTQGGGLGGGGMVMGRGKEWGACSEPPFLLRGWGAFGLSV